MLTRPAFNGLITIAAMLATAILAGCGSKGDLILPRADGGAPPAVSRQQTSTTVPIQPAIPSPIPIPPETAPSTSPASQKP
ncbi:MAG: lipoprotein [Casimicrobiaceae bacterium]